MRWRGRRQSSQVEDRRGSRGPMVAGGGIGCGGLILVLVIAYLTGQDPQQMAEVVQQMQQPAQRQAPSSTGGEPQDELGQFASTVLADTEDTWNQIFSRDGQRYRLPGMVIFSRSVTSACGMTSAAVGPFYCPSDQKVYIDLTFFNELDRRFGAPGDFAQAYVIAHEVGHHVQNLLGVSSQVQQAQQRMSRTQGNDLSVRLELQADCYAGVWTYYAHRERQLLEPGDVEEGLRAAAAIGDDRLQRMATGSTQRESWTHGSSEQRSRWLRIGMETGDPSRCDTFQASRL